MLAIHCIKGHDMRNLKMMTGLLAALSLPALAQAETLTLTINGIAKVQGTLRIGVYAQDGYENGDVVTGVNVKVDADTEAATFDGLVPGTYAIKLFHDVDDDGKLSTNPFGLPTEPYAFSNNARGSFGPASWEKAKFDVTAAGAVQTIDLK